MTRPNTMRLGIHKAENESEAHREPLKKLRAFKAPERQEPRPTDCIHLAGVFGGQALGQAASQILGVHRVFLKQDKSGIAITPAFLQEYRRSGGNESELWDRDAVAIDLPKIRYDANGAVGSEVRLAYRSGQYHEP